MMMIAWYLLAVFLVLIAWCEYYTFKTGVPTLVSFPSAQKKIIEILRTKIDSGELSPTCKIIDLGSGGGQLTWRIAKAFPEANVEGIEISIVPWARSVIRQKLLGAKNLRYTRKDFWPYDISTVDVVILYVTENIFDRLSEKLKNELKTGAIILANDTFLSKGWEAQETHDTGFLKLKVMVYRKE